MKLPKFLPLFPHRVDIKFGTEGWRGVIAEDFTFQNVRLVTQAIANYVIKENLSSKGIVVGYDCRFLSSQFAKEVALVLSLNNINSYLASSPCTSPNLSFMATRFGGGIMITASHNPPEFNGIKFKANYGGSADEDIVNGIEVELRKLLTGEPLVIYLKDKNPYFNLIEVQQPYMEWLYNWIEKNSEIKTFSGQVIVDPMHGSASGYFVKLLKDTQWDVKEIRSNINPSFGGVNPEPITQNLNLLAEAMKKNKAIIGIALDGDGDRIGVWDPGYGFINPQQIFAILLYYLIKKGDRGAVVKTISTTQMIDILAKKYGLKIYQTPVGFKHICKVMLKKDVLIGGEESGGIGFRGHLPERDGIFAGLQILELIAKSQKPFSWWLNSLEEEIGRFYYKREDIHCETAGVKEMLIKLKPSYILKEKVEEIIELDGKKFLMADSSWLLFRVSGTEPVVRIYAESRDKEKTDSLIKWAKELLIPATL